MALSSLNFYNKIKLKVAKKIYPVRDPKILFLDNLDLELQKIKINKVKFSALSHPKISSDYCPPKRDIIEADLSPRYIVALKCKNMECGYNLFVRTAQRHIRKKVKITCSKCKQFFEVTLSEDFMIHDLSSWLEDRIPFPEIESIPILFKNPRKAGKIFEKTDETEKELLFPPDEGDKKCIHGVKKRWCFNCIEKEKKKKEEESFKIDPFDLIFPILQPPLGDNFDNSIAFPNELYDFQRTGIKFLTEHSSALLGDEMGLGKTIQAICAARFLFRMGKVNKCLVLCPRSVISTWEQEFGDWAPELRLIKIRGSKENRQIFWNCVGHIYLTTYETLRQDLQFLINKEISEFENSSESVIKFNEKINEDKNLKDQENRKFDLIILDEVQKIKNPTADITKTVRKFHIFHRWGLSGTPLENRIEELISIFAYLKPKLLTYQDAIKPWKVKNTIEPFFLRRKKADVLPELPEKVHEEKWLELSGTQKETYDQLERESRIVLTEGSEKITISHILAWISKLKQICNIDSISKKSCKLEYLTEVLKEITEQGDKALIFSQYPEKTLKLIEPALEKFNPNIYHGSLSDKKRSQIIKKFQDDEENKILLMSTKAGGLGLTLTRACYVFHFDFWWNPAVASQAEDRAHRIGQKKTVFVTSLFTKDTIEERIQQILKRKRKLFKEIIDDLSDTNLSNVLTEEELFGLFGLEKTDHLKQNIQKKDRFSYENILEEITPMGFEQLIGNLYEKMGYYTKITQQSRDEGIDIYAKRRSESGVEHLAIQCKHSPNGVIGVKTARELYGVIYSKTDITRGVLITSGTYSRDCKDFVEGVRVELIDRTYLLGLLEKYDLLIKK